MADTIHQMNEKVQKGLKRARLYAKDNPELLAFLDILEYAYNYRVEEVVSLASNIWAFEWRQKDEALAWMEEKRENVNSTKIPNTSLRSELVN